MARPSKLSQAQKIEACRRMASGTESIREIGREMGISETTLRRNFSAQAPIIRTLATRLSATEIDIGRLPVTAQESIRTLATQMTMVSKHLANAAEDGAKVQAILAGKALKLAEKIGEDYSEDGEARKQLKAINALATTGNEAARTALTLVAASNKTEERPGGLEALLDGTWGAK